MIVHVYRRSRLARSLNDVWIATDSEEIVRAARDFGCQVVLTSSEHPNGTCRIAEAAERLRSEGKIADDVLVVNIQGDEALVMPDHIDAAVTGLQGSPNHAIAMLVNPFYKRGSPSDIKVVLNERSEIMYFSRADIPSDARTPGAPMTKAYHVVPFRLSLLREFAAWPETRLEKIEYIEYMRLLEKGRKILAVPVESSAVSVDTAADLASVREAMASDPLFKRYCAGRDG